MPWKSCEDCNTAHLELNDELTLWNIGSDYLLKDRTMPLMTFSLKRILKLVM